MSPRPGGDVSNSAEFAVMGTPVETPALTPEQIAPETPPKPRLRDVSKSVAERIVREHPTLVFTLLYLGLTYVGLMHDVFFYMYFKVNILEFSETGDFLLAAIRNPLTIFLALLPLPLLLLLRRFTRVMGKTNSWYGRYTRKYENTVWNGVSMRAVSAAIFILIYVTLFTELYAFREAAKVHSGKGKRVAFLRNDGIASDEQPILLGTTGKFLLLYYPSRRATEVVPIENATALTIDSRRRKDRERDSAAAGAIDTLTN